MRHTQPRHHRHNRKSSPFVAGNRRISLIDLTSWKRLAWRGHVLCERRTREIQEEECEGTQKKSIRCLKMSSTEKRNHTECKEIEMVLRWMDTYIEQASSSLYHAKMIRKRCVGLCNTMLRFAEPDPLVYIYGRGCQLQDTLSFILPFPILPSGTRLSFSNRPHFTEGSNAFGRSILV